MHPYLVSAACFQLTGAVQSNTDKRYISWRHVIPQRSLAPRLLLTWTSILIVATSPFVWFHLVSGGPSTSIQTSEAQSNNPALRLVPSGQWRSVDVDPDVRGSVQVSEAGSLCVHAVVCAAGRRSSVRLLSATSYLDNYST